MLSRQESLGQQFAVAHDIDILIKFRGKKSLFDLSRLELELEKTLGKEVDVVTYNSLHPLIREQVMKEEVASYDEEQCSFLGTHSGEYQQN